MIDSALIAKTIDEIQNSGNKVLVFIVPVNPEALEACGVPAEEIEQGLQDSLIESLNGYLGTPRPGFDRETADEQAAQDENFG